MFSNGYDMGFKVKMFIRMSFQKLEQLLFPYKVNFHQRKLQQPRSYNTEYLPRVKQWTKPVFLLFLTNPKSREQTFFSVSPFRETPPESASLTYPDGIACPRAEKDSTFFFKITKCLEILSVKVTQLAPKRFPTATTRVIRHTWANYVVRKTCFPMTYKLWCGTIRALGNNWHH